MFYLALTWNFLRLSSLLVGLTVDRFDGSKVGDEIHLRLGLPGSKILQPVSGSLSSQKISIRDECFFVDEGKVLPPPLSYWRHKHRMIKKWADETLIRDEIQFKTSPGFLESSMLPVLKYQFKRRGPVIASFLASSETYSLPNL